MGYLQLFLVLQVAVPNGVPTVCQLTALRANHALGVGVLPSVSLMQAFRAQPQAARSQDDGRKEAAAVGAQAIDVNRSDIVWLPHARLWPAKQTCRRRRARHQK